MKASEIKIEKLRLAESIIRKAKKLGLYKKMSNNQYPTANLLAASHTLPELKKMEKGFK